MPAAAASWVDAVLQDPTFERCVVLGLCFCMLCVSFFLASVEIYVGSFDEVLYKEEEEGDGRVEYMCDLCYRFVHVLKTFNGT